MWGLFFTGCQSEHSSDEKPAKVGLLFSLSGNYADFEKPIMDGALLAIEELNRGKGVDGRKIEPVIVDGESDAQKYKSGVLRLIEDYKVDVIVGGWHCLSREMAVNLFEANKTLLFFPFQSKGMVIAPFIVPTGIIASQEVVPGVTWAVKNLGKKFFLVGTKETYPIAVHAIARDVLYAVGGQVVGEEYVEGENVDQIVQLIKESKPDVLVCTLLGKSVIAFYQSLRKAGLSSKEVPSLGFTLDELVVDQLMKAKIDMTGDYGVASYFQSLANPANKEFLEQYKKKYGQDKVVSDSIVSAYLAVMLWAKTVDSIKSFNDTQVIESISSESLMSPGGLVCLDSKTNHLYKNVYIGQILSTGQYKVLWQSDYPVVPNLYPSFRTPQEWDDLMKKMMAK